jgi:hypothetical protein
VLDYSSLFIVQCFFGGISLPRGLCWFILGVTGGILCDTWLSPVWAAEYLAGRFGASGGSSLSVMWHGDTFYRLGVLNVVVLILIGALFLPSGSSVSARFWSHGAHAVCFHILVTILDPFLLYVSWLGH